MTGVQTCALPIWVGFTWNIFDGLNREANIRQARLTKQTLQLGREKVQNELGYSLLIACAIMWDVV